MNDWKQQLRDVRDALPEGVGHEVQHIFLRSAPTLTGGLPLNLGKVQVKSTQKRGTLPLFDAGGLVHTPDGLMFNRELWNRQQEARRILAMIPHNILVIGWKVMHEATLSIQESLELFKFRRKWAKEHGDMMMPWEKEENLT